MSDGEVGANSAGQLVDEWRFAPVRFDGSDGETSSCFGRLTFERDKLAAASHYSAIALRLLDGNARIGARRAAGRSSAVALMSLGSVAGILLASAVALGSLSVPARAQDASCACVAPAGSNARISEAGGRVLATQTAGLLPAGAGTMLAPGSRVIVGQQSFATVELPPECSVRLGSNAEVEVSKLSDGQVCLLVTAEPQPKIVETEPAGNGSGLAGALLAVAGIGGIIGVVVSIGDDDPVSD
ncbi:hypothetical protein [Mesorhizobium sp. 10J20-29]